MMATVQNWIVIGASSSIGRALVRLAAWRGADVVLAGRDMEDMARTAADIRVSTGRKVSTIFFDATDPASHDALLATACATQGVLNVALLFATMPEQSVLDRDPDLAMLCLDTGLRGAVSILQRLAPVLAARGAGTIIGFGSVAGDRGRLRNYVYGATKAGLHVYLTGLRNRLARSGVHVLTVKPGFVDTSMTWGLPGMFLVASPGQIAAASLDAAARGRNVIYTPWFWRLIMSIVCLIPERVFKRLSI
jgi:short-subunit dehydrogenase